jgi:hypothetical protein
MATRNIFQLYLEISGVNRGLQSGPALSALRASFTQNLIGAAKHDSSLKVPPSNPIRGSSLQTHSRLLHLRAFLLTCWQQALPFSIEQVADVTNVRTWNEPDVTKPSMGISR